METTAYGCEILFSSERAQAVQDLIEGATGELCPCKQGRVCPLLPQELPVVQVPQVGVTSAA